MNVVIISMYDNYCFGARMLAPYLRRLGHRVQLVVFKGFKVPFFRYDDAEAPDLGQRPEILSVRRQEIGGHYFCPYTDPVTEAEKDLLLDLLGEFKPDVIAFSLTSIYVELAEELTALVKGRFPGSPVVWGGIHPTSDPEHSLAHADAICRGEGEAAFAEYLEDPSRRDVANFWYKDADGAIIKNPQRPLLADLDDLPWASYGEDEYLIDYDRCLKKELSDVDYFRSYCIVMTQRGCPFSCSYCLHDLVRNLYKKQKYMRRRSVDNVLDEIALRLEQFDLRDIYFWDEIFVKDRAWIAEFSEKYPRRFSTKFGGYAYAKISKREMLDRLKAAGMGYIAFGVQSGSDRILKLYNRACNPADLLKTASDADAAGLPMAYDLLTNNPYESEEDLRETLRFIYQLPKPGGYLLLHLRLFPHLRLGENGEERHDLPPAVFVLWNYLYFLALERLLPEAEVLRLAEDAELRRDATPLIERTIQLKRERDGKAPGYDEPEKQYQHPRPAAGESPRRSLVRRALGRLVRTLKPAS